MQESNKINSMDDDLKYLTGVSAYDTAAFEKDVIKQLDKDVRVKQRASAQKKVDHIVKEIGSLKSLIEKNDNAGKYFATKPYSYGNQEKLKTLIIQREKYVHSLKLFEKKLKTVEDYISTLSESSGNSITNHNDSSPYTLKFDKAEVSKAHTLKERRELIKQGLETPFSNPQIPSPPKQPNIKFDDGFLNSLSTNISKKGKTIQEKSLPHQTNKRHSILDLELDTKRRKESLDEEFIPVEDKDSTQEYSPGENSSCSDEEKYLIRGSSKKRTKNRKCVDDANPKTFKRRILKYKQQLIQEQLDANEFREDKVFEGGFKVPGRIWQKLYKYQKTGVKWLWELHSQHTGGILGDEMGLGKTIQVISFLAGLYQSKLRDRASAYSYNGLGPVLLVVPATVMQQWVSHLHSWFPQVRTAILHSSGSHKSVNGNLISNIVLSRGILITSYERVRISIDELLSKNWHYVILDEGHKIKNPDSAITHAVKLFPTPHRIILSGTPIQNNLKELWSLFDFVFPGKLGTLPVFMEQFSIPIVQGGYACATDVEVQTAYKCACMLKSTISPYLLRRMKADVKSDFYLPDKTDQVLFCSMTNHQVEVYKQYLDSETVYSILNKNTKVFVGLIQLRKICNHPDLYTGGHKLLTGQLQPEYGDDRRFGYWERSGKMIVVQSLLRIWKKQNKKVLLFSQSKAMLMILEDFVKSQEYSYLLMHGGTAIQSRSSIVDEFNTDPNIFIFLLTTRVGGLGINLVGADRVILFDPDWNPSTDSQAQERAWRIGQKKQVTIYRLITAGTIEEKIYHRQIFKHFVTNRVLKDPRQRRFFKNNDMHELFTLNDQDSDKIGKTETASIFAGTGSEINIKERVERKRERRERKRLNKEEERSSSPTMKSSNATSTNHTANNISDCNINLKETKNPTASDCNTLNSKPQSTTENIAIENSPSEIPTPTKLRSSFLKVLEKFRSEKIEIPPKKEKPTKKSRQCDVDGETVKNVLKQKKYKTKKANEERARSDDYVLAKLFNKGVHSALKHSTIMESTNQDYTIVESEANRVAREALKNLKYSRKNYRYPQAKQNSKPRFGKLEKAKTNKKNIEPKLNNVATPPKLDLSKEWEARSSSSDDDTNATSKATFGSSNEPCSSSQLLLEMRRRNHFHEDQKSDSEDSASEVVTGDFVDEAATKNNELLTQIINFIDLECGGEVSTGKVMERFSGFVETQDVPKFKSMLHHVCVMSKDFDGSTKWVLKRKLC